MKIILNANNFNMIMKTCKIFVAKDDVLPILTQIELTCDGETVTAVAMDKASIVKLTVPCERGSGTGKMLVPVTMPVERNVSYVYVFHDKNLELTIETESVRQTFRGIAGEYFDHTRVLPPKGDPVLEWQFDPKRLANALSVFRSEPVTLSFYQIGLVLSDPVKQALVLPLRRTSEL